jgi:hypothetical protein
MEMLKESPGAKAQSTRPSNNKIAPSDPVHKSPNTSSVMSTTDSAHVATAKNLSLRLSYTSTDLLEDQDTSMMGFKMSTSVQAKWDRPVPEYLKWTKMERFFHVCKCFPMHWMWHNLYCAPMIVAALIPVFIVSEHAQTMVRVRSRGSKSLRTWLEGACARARLSGLCRACL